MSQEWVVLILLLHTPLLGLQVFLPPPPPPIHHIQKKLQCSVPSPWHIYVLEPKVVGI